MSAGPPETSANTPAGEAANGTAPRPVPWPVRRLFPLLATVGLAAIGMASTIWWVPHLAGSPGWALPHDLWRTLIAARRLVRLHWGGLYTPPTALISFPGAAVILVPVVAVIDAAGLSLQIPGPGNLYPDAWLLAGPYAVAVSAVVLLAADAIAERLGVTRTGRALLAGAGAVALWNVTVRWGHPEDAIAVGLFLYGVLALSDSHVRRAAWLTGGAVAVQPLVLLALPVVLMAIQPRRLPGFLTRAATPAAVTLGAAALANWKATVSAVTNQPNWPTLDHPTPWTSLAPHVADGAVLAGPARLLAVAVAAGCAVIAGRRWRALRQPAAGQPVSWSPEILRDLLWWAAVTLALRCAFEPVMVAYYLWPALAIALIAAAGSWTRLAATSLAAGALTFVSQLSWSGPWAWWGPMVAGLGAVLLLARLPLRRSALTRAAATMTAVFPGRG